MALLQILNRPRPNFMIIDERFACLDKVNMENISVFLEEIRKNNDFALIISHVDNIKSECESTIEIISTNEGSKISTTV